MTGSILQAAPTGADGVRLGPLQQARRYWLPAAAWAATVLLMYELLVAVDYPLRDPDSSLYQAIAASLQDRPWAEWLAPMWPAGSAKAGRFVEHLPYFFWPAAALGRLGLARGALLANLIYFLACLYLLFLIARPPLRAEGAWLAVALYAVSPVGIQYLVRANHENAWAIGFLGALHCLRNPDGRTAPRVGLVLFAVLAFAIKGVLALSLFPVLGLWWWLTSRRREELLAFAAAAFAIAMLALWHEWSYRRLTGDSFFASYLGAQIRYVRHDEAFGWLRKLINPVYYAGNLLWFALPSSLMTVAAIYSRRRAGQDVTEAQALACVGTGGFFALALPISRRAARYIFPAYPLIHLPAAELICERVPRLGALLRRNQAHLPYALMLLLMLLLAARVMASLRLHHFIQVF